MALYPHTTRKEPMLPMVLVALLIALFFFMPFLFQFLWNMTVPEIFGLRAITYWQALRLLLMAAMLFGSGQLVHFNFNP